MKTKKKAIIIIAIAVCAIAAIFISLLTLGASKADAETKNLTKEYKTSECLVEKINDTAFPEYKYKSEGYDNFPEWWEALKETRSAWNGYIDSQVEELGDYFPFDQEDKLRELEKKIVNALCLTDIQTCSDQINEILLPYTEQKAVSEESVYYQSTNSNNYNYSQYSSSNGSGLTPQSGVNWYNGRKETYYSSNVLYHYRTPEWTLGSDGVYRDSAGFVVVAASDLAQGATVDTSFGAGKVYDTGCAAGVTDVYCNW